MKAATQITSVKNKYLLAIIALAAIPISGLSIDIYVPSLPAVSYYFHADKSLVQLTITMYLIGIGFVSLFSGNIADTIGRRYPFIVSMSTYVLVTLLAPMSNTIYQLLVARLIQGMASGFFIVAMRSVIPDLFEGREFYKMISYTTIAWAIGPIIAPAIGGYLQHYIGWQATFYFLAIYGSAILVLHFIYMPETLREKKSLHVGNAIRTYCRILTNLSYWVGLVCLGLVYSLLILFGVVCSFLIQEVLHYNAIEFGRMALLMGVGWFLGNITNRLLIDLSLEKKAKRCFLSMLIVSVVMLILALIYPINIYTIVVPTFLLLYFGGMIFPNYFGRNIALFPDASGAANALTGGFMVLIAGCSSGLGALLKSNSQLPLSITYVVTVTICLVACYVDAMHRRFD